MTRVTDYMKGRLFRIILISGVAYAVAAFLTEAPSLILVLNGLLLSVSAGVMVAYAPVVFDGLSTPKPSKGDYLGAGIFFSWLAIWGNRVLSFLARDAGYPEVFNSHVMSLVIATSLLGGLFHLWAPNAVEGRLPRERWVTTGIVVAIGLFIVFGAWTTHLRVAVHPPIQLR